MMRSIGVLLSLLTLIGPVKHDSETLSTADVPKAIEQFRPAWLPHKGELPGVVVVLAPVQAGQADADYRRNDDLSRMTAAYLYHLIKRAGGEAVVAQVPYGTTPQADRQSDVSLARLCAAAQCHALLRIVFGGPAPVARPPTDANASAADAMRLSRALADALSRTLGVPCTSTASSCIPGVPAAEVRFAAMEPSKESNDGVPIHRACAEELCKRIIAYAQAHFEELEAARLKQWPGARTANPAIPQIDMSPTAKVGRAARLVWPEGILPLEKAPWYCLMYRAVALSDRTIIHFEPAAVIEGDTVVLRGTSTVRKLCETLERALHVVGIDHVRNEMRVVPDRDRVGERIFGACIAPMALTRVKPAEIVSVQTQILYGEPLFLLDRAEGRYLVQAGDGYWGWVFEDAVRPMTRDDFRRYTAAQVVFVRDVALPDGRICRGARLPLVSRDGETLTLARPEGGSIGVPAAAVRALDDPSVADACVCAALRMLYVPYVFGGRSPIGLDCSGLVGNVSEQAGITLARDAAQQFAAGRLVATSWYRDDLRAGDRIYFIDGAGKIYHTGLMISPTHFIHSSPPGVQISSLKKGDRLYVARWDQDFLAAKRP
jgi:hypothetical protein